MVDLGHLKVKLEVEFRHQSFFPMILIFWRIFPPSFKFLSQKGKKSRFLIFWHTFALVAKNRDFQP